LTQARRLLRETPSLDVSRSFNCDTWAAQIHA
jgi:hypothetical protein